MKYLGDHHYFGKAIQFAQLLNRRYWKPLIIVIAGGLAPLAYNACGNSGLSLNNSAGSQGILTAIGSQLVVSPVMSSLTLAAQPGQSISFSLPLTNSASAIETIQSVAAAQSTTTTITSLLTTVAGTTNFASCSPCSYYLHVRQGTSPGLDLQINSYTAGTTATALSNGSETFSNSLVVANPAGVTSAQLSNLLKQGDVFEIIAANTIGSVFTTAGSGDEVQLYTAGAWNTYTYNGTEWIVGTSGSTSAAAVIIPPESGGIYVRSSNASSEMTLTLTGRTPANSLVTLIPAAGVSTMVANRFPMPINLSSLNFQSFSGWSTNANSASADTVSIWGGSSWCSFYNNGSSWVLSANSASGCGSQAIGAGSAIFVTRRSSTSTLTPTVSQTAGYQLNIMGH